jgi:U4/U6.U5 tri-snRNP component SNU23
MSSSINKNVNVERRTWDKETYEARARSRAETTESSDLPQKNNDTSAKSEEETPEEFQKASSDRAGPMGSKRAFLKSRSNRVDLTSKLGSVEIIDPKAASNVGGGAVVTGNGVTKCSDGVGWHCRVCDCFLKDSLTYLDHINGKKHQRYLGYSMRVEKSTAEEVGSVLKGLAEKKSNEAGADVVESVDFEEVVKAKEEEALRRKQERAKRREERKKRARGEHVDGEDDQNSLNVTNDKSESDNPANEAENVYGERDAEEGVEDEEEEGNDIDPNIAAMMGFSGFGGSRKS